MIPPDSKPQTKLRPPGVWRTQLIENFSSAAVNENIIIKNNENVSPLGASIRKNKGDLKNNSAQELQESRIQTKSHHHYRSELSQQPKFNKGSQHVLSGSASLSTRQNSSPSQCKTAAASKSKAAGAPSNIRFHRSNSRIAARTTCKVARCAITNVKEKPNNSDETQKTYLAEKTVALLKDLQLEEAQFLDNHKRLITEQSRYDELEDKLSRTILDLEAEESAVEVFLKSQENKEQQLKLKLQQLKMETSALSRNLLAVDSEVENVRRSIRQQLEMLESSKTTHVKMSSVIYDLKQQVMESAKNVSNLESQLERDLNPLIRLEVKIQMMLRDVYFICRLWSSKGPSRGNVRIAIQPPLSSSPTTENVKHQIIKIVDDNSISYTADNDYSSTVDNDYTNNSNETTNFINPTPTAIINNNNAYDNNADGKVLNTEHNIIGDNTFKRNENKNVGDNSSKNYYLQVPDGGNGKPSTDSNTIRIDDAAGKVSAPGFLKVSIVSTSNNNSHPSDSNSSSSRPLNQTLPPQTVVRIARCGFEGNSNPSLSAHSMEIPFDKVIVFDQASRPHSLLLTKWEDLKPPLLSDVFSVPREPRVSLVDVFEQTQILRHCEITLEEFLDIQESPSKPSLIAFVNLGQFSRRKIDNMSQKVESSKSYDDKNTIDSNDGSTLTFWGSSEPRMIFEKPICGEFLNEPTKNRQPQKIEGILESGIKFLFKIINERNQLISKESNLSFLTMNDETNASDFLKNHYVQHNNNNDDVDNSSSDDNVHKNCNRNLLWQIEASITICKPNTKIQQEQHYLTSSSLCSATELKAEETTKNKANIRKSISSPALTLLPLENLNNSTFIAKNEITEKSVFDVLDELRNAPGMQLCGLEDSLMEEEEEDYFDNPNSSYQYDIQNFHGYNSALPPSLSSTLSSNFKSADSCSAPSSCSSSQSRWIVKPAVDEYKINQNTSSNPRVVPCLPLSSINQSVSPSYQNLEFKKFNTENDLLKKINEVINRILTHRDPVLSENEKTPSLRLLSPSSSSSSSTDTQVETVDAFNLSSPLSPFHTAIMINVHPPSSIKLNSNNSNKQAALERLDSFPFVLSMIYYESIANNIVKTVLFVDARVQMQTGSLDCNETVTLEDDPNISELLEAIEGFPRPSLRPGSAIAEGSGIRSLSTARLIKQRSNLGKLSARLISIPPTNTTAAASVFKQQCLASTLSYDTPRLSPSNNNNQQPLDESKSTAFSSLIKRPVCTPIGNVMYYFISKVVESLNGRQFVAIGGKPSRGRELPLTCCSTATDYGGCLTVISHLGYPRYPDDTTVYNLMERLNSLIHNQKL